MQKLRGCGYTPQAKIIEAWKYGVPQHRQRTFIVAVIRGLEFNWPSPENDHNTLWDAIGDLPTVQGGQRVESIPYPDNGRSRIIRWYRGNLDSTEDCLVRDHITREVRLDDAEIFSLMMPGQTYKDVPERLRRYRVDIFDDKYFRLSKDGLSRSITAHLAKDGYGFIHPEQDRTLSVTEAARIQTFPDRFRFAGHPTNRFKQIGNAVPPFLSKAIGEAIIDTLASDGHEKRLSQSTGKIRSKLRKWHKKEGRSFPWRSSSDPWNVLLAEICLRRTRADQVATIYDELVDLAATPKQLITNWEDVRRLLSHLGLSWRTENLLSLATTIENQFHSETPSSWEDLTSLEGVGDYVASATRCFGFGRQSILLDVNTSRICRRLTGQLAISKSGLRILLNDIAGPQGPDAQWNYMLLDLGGLICTSGNPKCGLCPLRSWCSTGNDAAERSDHLIEGPK